MVVFFLIRNVTIKKIVCQVENVDNTVMNNTCSGSKFEITDVRAREI